MTKPRAPNAVDCHICHKTINRKADLARHMRLHSANKEEFMYACPYDGCMYKTLQRSNLTTHLNVHTGERPHKCPTEGCEFATSDPGSLTRHRRICPKVNATGQSTSVTRKAARRQRRVSPYTTSSASPISSGRPSSPLGPSRSTHQAPQTLDLCPPPSLLRTVDQKAIKNTSAAYSSELITKFPQADNHSNSTPNSEKENHPPLTSSTTLNPAPAVEYPQPRALEQWDLDAIDIPALIASDFTPEISETMLDEFLAQLNGWKNPFAIPYTTLSASMPLVPYAVGNIAPPTSVPLPQAAAQYTFDSPPVPTSAPTSSYEYTVDNAAYGYPTQTASFDSQFSQTCSFAPPSTNQSYQNQLHQHQSYQNQFYQNQSYQNHSYQNHSYQDQPHLNQTYVYSVPGATGMYPSLQMEGSALY